MNIYISCLTCLIFYRDRVSMGLFDLMLNYTGLRKIGRIMHFNRWLDWKDFQEWSDTSLDLNNYGEYVVGQLMSTTFFKNKLTDILMAITANFIEAQTVTLLCHNLSIHPYVDYFLQITISITLAINIHWFQRLLIGYRAEFYRLSRYLINNYSFENYIYWKRMVVTGLVGYGLIILSIIEVNNRLIVIYLTQAFINFLVIDRYEQKFFHKLLEEYKNRPVSRFHEEMPKDLIESYFPGRLEQLKKKDSEFVPIQGDESSCGQRVLTWREEKYDSTDEDENLPRVYIPISSTKMVETVEMNEMTNSEIERDMKRNLMLDNSFLINSKIKGETVRRSYSF